MGKWWSKKDETMLWDLYRDGWTNQQLQKIFPNRTASAIRHKLQDLNRWRWDEWELGMLSWGIRQGKTDETIANKLSMRPGLVKQKREEMIRHAEYIVEAVA